jgi:hypothetical protein
MGVLFLLKIFSCAISLLPRILLGTPGAESMVFLFQQKVSVKSSENPLGFSWHKRVAWKERNLQFPKDTSP